MIKIKTTQEAENERVAQEKMTRPTFELLKTTSLVRALRFAKEHGWKEKKIQVRSEQDGGRETFYVEPFEKDCSCPNILKYSEYFL